MKSRNAWTTPAWIALSVALAGCVTVAVEPVPALEEAGSLYRQAAADPEVQTRAPGELSIAARLLGEAERAWRDKAPEEELSHKAYLAGQQARVALATAQYRAAEAKIATAREQRTRLLLEAREREAAEAKERARAAQAARAAAKPVEAPAPAPDIDAGLARLQSEVPQLRARHSERGWILTLRNEALFDGDVLRPGAAATLDNLAGFLREQPQRDIAIEGFTDTGGSSVANRRLSESRAQALREALVARGIEPRRIEARGYGDSFPVASNDTAGGRQLNRRVEIVINPS